MVHIFENLWHFDGFKIWKSMNPPAGHNCPKTQKYQKLKLLNVVNAIMYDVMTMLDFCFEVQKLSQTYLPVWNWLEFFKLKLEHPCDACVGPTMKFPPKKILGILIRVWSIQIPSLIFDLPLSVVELWSRIKKVSKTHPPAYFFSSGTVPVQSSGASKVPKFPSLWETSSKFTYINNHTNRALEYCLEQNQIESMQQSYQRITTINNQLQTDTA